MAARRGPWATLDDDPEAKLRMFLVAGK